MPPTVSVAGELTVGLAGLLVSVTGSEPTTTEVERLPESPLPSLDVAVAV